MYGKFQEHLTCELEKIRKDGLYKQERVICSEQGAEITLNDGRKALNFCANNYLGLANSPRLIEAAKRTMDARGYGMSSVRFICGTQDVHLELEKAVSRYFHTEDTILYAACFDANGGVFEPLLTAEDAIISDSLNHASIIDGVRLCKAVRYRYANSDMTELERCLQEAQAQRFRIIVTDGVFSMDGNVAPMDKICDLAEKYDALVMVDESHSAGVVGPTGRGVGELYDCYDRIDIHTGTLGKAFGGAVGGFTTGRKEIIEMLRQRSRPYLFSNSLPPMIAGAGVELFKMLEENQYKIQYRVMLARYRGKTVCPACHGSRLKKEALYVKVGGKNIAEIVSMPINDVVEFFRTLKLDEHDTAVAARLLNEIGNRLKFLQDVGLGYLTLNRLSNTLSGGESQRINLATSLGSSLVGSLYILDEPSIGLHSRDTDKLIKVLRQLQQLGNTVVVVEHDEEIIRAADYIIDIGPKAGRLGGQIVYQGNMSDLKPGSDSYTVKYLLGEERIPLPLSHRSWNNYIEIKGARENNLNGIDVKFPLNVMTVVTGVSGSGKSTLVRDIFYKALKREYSEVSDRPGEFLSLEGDVKMVHDIEFVDQNPIGKSSRSNPVTYVKAYDEIRKLMADQPLSKQMGYTAGYFSFNTEGGRCEECKGEGTVTVEMQFMADLVLECESCHGKRFKNETLEVKYDGMNIYDILEMTVNQAVEFFNEHGQKKIVKKLLPLQEVGLGYIKLGQSSSTLSGGENQRVKLAYFLSIEKAEPTIFVFAEPTTGLHFHDIKQLLKAFDALIARGHTVVIIEHNMDVIKCADHVIDLGPEGGDKGGNLVVCGTPEEVAKCAASYTGQYLAEKLAE